MIFAERQVEGGFTYTVTDIFGTIVLTSAKKLGRDDLDAYTGAILKAGIRSGTINDDLSFDFQKATDWLADDEGSKVPTVSGKSRTVALLLCLFLGGFGAHRFYTGKTVTGLLQLILTSSMVGIVFSGPWAVMDFFMILGGKYNDKADAPVSNW